MRFLVSRNKDNIENQLHIQLSTSWFFHFYNLSFIFIYVLYYAKLGSKPIMSARHTSSYDAAHYLPDELLTTI